MGKRSNFPRIDKDFYQTPKEAVEPLLPFLKGDGVLFYYEPCVGKGALIKAFQKISPMIFCAGASDSEKDATTYKYITNAQYFITNPPWSRELLHPIIENLSSQLPTWLLFDAGWMFTRQSIPYLKYCHKIVTVGRIKWIPGSQYTGKDDCCWYLFDNTEKTIRTFAGTPPYTEFYGKQEK